VRGLRNIFEGHIYTGMTKETDGQQERAPSGREAAAKGNAPRPEWALGLRRLYDSVVDEDLPDSFKALLSKLDDAG